MAYLDDYISAFGEVQSAWISKVIFEELGSFRVWTIAHAPAFIAKPLALRTGLAITRSFIPTRNNQAIGNFPTGYDEASYGC